MEFLKTLQSTSAEVNALGALLTDSNGFTIQASGELPVESGCYIRSLSQRAHYLAKATGEPSNGSPPVVTIETKDRNITVRTIEDHGQQYSLALIADSNQVHAPPKDSQSLDHGAKSASGSHHHQQEAAKEAEEEGSVNTAEEEEEEDNGDDHEQQRETTTTAADDDEHNNDNTSTTMEEEEDGGGHPPTD